jgi:hypothetical protein
MSKSGDKSNQNKHREKETFGRWNHKPYLEGWKFGTHHFHVEKWGLVRLLVADMREVSYPEAGVTAVPSSRDSKRDG